MMEIPAELTSNVLHKAIGRYYKELQDYESKGATELNLRPAFQTLLAEMARRVNLTLMHEMTISGRIRPDGVLVTAWNIRRGYWEAKGPKGNLEAEIEQKKRDGYPLDNALFENTRQAVLFQGGQRYEFDMKVMGDVTVMLQRFLVYQKPETANFEQAVLDFKEQIPNIAKRLLELINTEYTRNAKFIAAFNAFNELCRTTLNPKIGVAEIKEMLVQHLLTERLFRTVFNNPDFVNKNVIAAEIEKVIQALTSRSFNRSEFLRDLDPFYGAIEGAARGIETWSERQRFLNTVYERFFQGFAVQKADTLGIVYTPQEIVDFMVASVDEVLKREFGKGLATPGVKILDPAVGTGNFIVNIIKRIPRSALREKYAHDLFCNEIALLPYYIASLNIEHEYYEKMQEYVPFEGVCFADTLELADIIGTDGRIVATQQALIITEENTARIQREKAADIMVVIGNPPYNVGQVSENDNNKNRKYTVIDQQIKETYVKASTAKLRTKLYDTYIKFFRWATDRLQGHDGIVCFISNNSFLKDITFDGMRKHLTQDFTHIYHLDLGGDARERDGGNIFNIRVGVGITILIRKKLEKDAKNINSKIFYFKAPDSKDKNDKLGFLASKNNLLHLDWQILEPDDRYAWLTKGLHDDFATLIPIGSKMVKSMGIIGTNVIYKTYSLGVSTNRDKVAYNFSRKMLSTVVQSFSEEYNSEVARWVRAGKPEELDNFVNYDKIKWSRNLKRDLVNQHYISFSENNICKATYRPFTSKWLYASDIVVDESGKSFTYFPQTTSDIENVVIAMSDHGHRSPFSTLAINSIPDLHILASTDAFQCFPYYTYAEDGSNRRENITDWALEQYRGRYGAEVSKWDVFHYVYAMLHHPQYRERYAENLKRDLPHIPLLRRAEVFQAAVRLGRALMELHVHYEEQEAYPLTVLEDESVPYEQLTYVEKMKLTPDRTALMVSKGLTLAGIPERCWSYRLGNRSALEWVIDQYQVTTDARSGITSNPNRVDDPEYIVRLVKQVVTVGVQTVALVEELAQAVRMEDWLEEQ